MSQKIVVLQMVHNLNFGGMERIIAELVSRLDPKRYEIHILVLSYLGHFAEGLERFATLHVADPLPPWSMLYPRSLVKHIRDIAPDIVHTHSGVWYKAGLAARLADVPILIHTDHGRPIPDTWITKYTDGLASRRSDAIVAVSDALAQQMRSIVAHPDRLCVIRNGVDTETFAQRPYDGSLHRELGISPDVPIIGANGRLEPVKGFDVMVEAFIQMWHDWTHTPRPVLAIIGSGSQLDPLRARAAQSEARDAIHLLGWRSDIAECLPAFTLFTMSSHSEGTSVSLLEAMSSGLCPVVTNVGGNAAVLGNPLRHRLVPPANPPALATAWRDALLDPDRRQADARAARDRVVHDFGLDTMVRQYEALYEALHQTRSTQVPHTHPIRSDTPSARRSFSATFELTARRD